MPLTEAERERMPDADTVWLTPLEEMHGVPGAGRAASSAGRRTAAASHRAVAESLIDAFAADATDIAAQIGRQALDELLAAHRLWSDWLRDRTRPQVRVRGGEDGVEPAGSRTGDLLAPSQTLSQSELWPRGRQL